MNRYHTRHTFIQSHYQTVHKWVYILMFLLNFDPTFNWLVINGAKQASKQKAN